MKSVLEVEVIRQQRAVQAPRSRGKFHRFRAENLVLVLGRELHPSSPSPRVRRPAIIARRRSSCDPPSERVRVSPNWLTTRVRASSSLGTNPRVF